MDSNLFTKWLLIFLTSSLLIAGGVWVYQDYISTTLATWVIIALMVVMTCISAKENTALLCFIFFIIIPMGITKLIHNAVLPEISGLLVWFMAVAVSLLGARHISMK